jgi:hypothetical protein
MGPINNSRSTFETSRQNMRLKHLKKYIKTLEKAIAKHMQVTDNTLATYM